MTTELTLEEQRDALRERLIQKRRTHASDKVTEAAELARLKAAYLAEARPEREFVTWVCGAGFEHVSQAAMYDRMNAAAAITAGVNVAQDGKAPVFSHLVAAGRRLKKGLTPAQVQDEVTAGVVTLRAAKPEQEGLTKVWFPDVTLPQLERVRTRVQEAFLMAGQPLPDNNPEIMAGVLDLIDSIADDYLAMAAREAVGTLPKYIQARFKDARLVKLSARTAEDHPIGTITALYGSDYSAQLTEAFPQWEMVTVSDIDTGIAQHMFYREEV